VKQDRQVKGKGEEREEARQKRERERGKDEIVRRLTSCILPGRRRLYRAPLHVQHAPSASPVHVRARTYSRVVLAGPSSRVSTPKTTPSQVARVTSRRCTGSRRFFYPDSMAPIHVPLYFIEKCLIRIKQ